jgi:hypothetical protein
MTCWNDLIRNIGHPSCLVSDGLLLAISFQTELKIINCYFENSMTCYKPMILFVFMNGTL